MNIFAQHYLIHINYEQNFAHRHVYAMNRVLAILLYKAIQRVS